MHYWYLAYNPKTNEGCYIQVVGSTGESSLVKDKELIRAFLRKNAGYSMEFSCEDELLDKLHDNNGVILNELPQNLKEKYIDEW